MKVLVLSNTELLDKEIGNGLEDLQKIVGGYIEIPFLGDVFNDNGIDVIINEEGKLIGGMNPEIAIVDKRSGNIIDIVYGNCIFASHDEEGNTVGLNGRQMIIVAEELKRIAMLSNLKMVRTLFI